MSAVNDFGVAGGGERGRKSVAETVSMGANLSWLRPGGHDCFIHEGKT